MELTFAVSEQKRNGVALRIQARLVLKSLWKWINAITKGIFSALFVPSATDQQIEQSRERVRQFMARTY